MPHRKYDKKIINSFTIIGVLVIVLGLFSVSQMRSLSSLTGKFHDHPLTVTIATHKINKYLISIHRYMKDVVLSQNEEELKTALNHIDMDVKNVYREFDIIFNTYLGDKRDVQKVYELFDNWSEIRESVIELVRQNRKSEATRMNKTVAYIHLNKIQESMLVVSEYAHNKARLFVKDSNETKDLSIRLITGIVVVVLALMISVIIILISSIRKAELLEKQQEKHLLENSRLAQMGELISMIAHQWRQPLSAITATAIELKMNMQLNQDKDKDKDCAKCSKHLIAGLDHIENFTQSLSTTIDDFRNFYKPNKILSRVNINEPIKKALNIVNSSFIENNIRVVDDFNSTTDIELYESELMQVFLNILQNSQDNFKELGTKDATIWIETNDTADGVVCNIYDNGGGMDEEIITKIFDPYFSTKHAKNGTGLGMYMSKIIIESHHKGVLSAQNRDEGLCITIKLSN